MDENAKDETKLEALQEAIMPPGQATKRREIPPEEAELWQRHFDGDAAARNELAEKFFPLVEVNAQNVVETIIKAIEESDFHQAAVVGFMESLDEYKSNRDMLFEEFSSLKIRAAILDELANYVRE